MLQQLQPVKWVDGAENAGHPDDVPEAEKAEHREPNEHHGAKDVADLPRAFGLKPKQDAENSAYRIDPDRQVVPALLHRVQRTRPDVAKHDTQCANAQAELGPPVGRRACRDAHETITIPDPAVEAQAVSVVLAKS